MKFKYFYTALVGIVLYIVLASNAGGYNGNATGSHGAGNGPVAGCSCHGTQNNDFPVSIEIDSNGTKVSQYKPGSNYTIKLTGINKTTTSLPKYGFQLSAVMANSKLTGSQGAAGQTMCTQAGKWGSNLPASTANVTMSGVNVISQSAPISATTGTGSTGSIYSVSIPWTAPAAGSGPVVFYGAMLGVNGNGSDKGDVQNLAKQLYINELGKGKACR